MCQKHTQHSGFPCNTEFFLPVALRTLLSQVPRHAPVLFLISSHPSAPLGSQWALVLAHMSPHLTLSRITAISFPRLPSPSTCGGHMFISGCSNSGSEQHRLLSLRSKGQKSGWAGLGWAVCPFWGSGKHCSQYHFPQMPAVLPCSHLEPGWLLLPSSLLFPSRDRGARVCHLKHI